MISKKVVYVTTFDVLGKASSGGNQCGKRNFEFICSTFGEENIYLCMITNEREPIYEEKVVVFPKIVGNRDALLSSLCNCKVYYQKDEKKIVSYINSKKPDLIFFESSLLGKLLNYVDASKTVVFFHNVEQLYAKNKVRHEGPWYWPSYKVSKYNEALSVKKAKGIISLNRRDRNLIYKLYGRKADILLPISFKDCFNEREALMMKDSTDKKQLLFVGSLFPPNLDGIEWFINSVMPLIPEYTLTVVGKDFEKKREKLQRENVEIIGFVEDLSKYYYRYPVIVMPIRYGDGMKVKTAEAMMYGKTIFATDEALEGYAVDEIEGIYRCNTETEFAKSIKKVFDTGKIPQYQIEVRNLFLNYYEDNKVFQKFQNYLKKIMGEY